MSGLARIMMDSGVKVSGSDRADSETVRSLAELGAEVFTGHSPNNIRDCDLVVYTAAVSEDNPELSAARSLGVPCMERAQFLGELMKNYKSSIAVCGTHGKSTTTGMVSCIFLQGQEKPSVLLGGNLSCIGGNVLIGSSNLLIMEACEYVDSFLQFNPCIILMLNIELDHLDYFKDIDQIKSSFSAFAEKIPENGFCVVNLDDENVRCVAESLGCRCITYSTESTEADYYAVGVSYGKFGFSEFDMYCKGKLLCRVRLRVSGRHNVSNAAGAFAVSHSFGMDTAEILRGLESFGGISRRFELKGERNGALFFDDYAHHPTEIKSTLMTAREMSDGGRIFCVFQPHTYTRTREFYREFAEALSIADTVILADIYAAREKPIEGVSSEMIGELLSGSLYIQGFSNIAEYLTESVQRGDIVICMGAGNICHVLDEIFGKKAECL